MRKLLYIDSSYTLAEIRERGLGHVLQIRHLEGYWDKLWSAHPLDLKPSDADHGLSPYGAPLVEQVTNNHTFVRGRAGHSKRLAPLAPINALLALVSFIFSLRHIVRREGINVIRAGDPLLCGLIGLIVAKSTGAKLMVRINADHDMIRADTSQAIMPRLFRVAAVEEWIERAILSRADQIVAPSKQYVDFAVRKGAAPEDCHILRYGNLIDARHLVAPEDRLPVEDATLARRLSERPWLLHIGRLLKLKHAGDCIDVLEIMADSGSNAGLCLVGDGPLQEEMAAKALAAGLAERVLFLGNCHQKFIARLVPYCSVVLSPLTGRSLSEVAFGGAAIVAYDLDWQGELVQNGRTGILVEAGDTLAMAKGALHLIKNPEQARFYGHAVRDRAMKLLDPAEQSRKEREIYMRMASCDPYETIQHAEMP